METAECHQNIKNQKSRSITDVRRHPHQRGQDKEDQGAGEGHLVLREGDIGQGHNLAAGIDIQDGDLEVVTEDPEVTIGDHDRPVAAGEDLVIQGH